MAKCNQLTPLPFKGLKHEILLSVCLLTEIANSSAQNGTVNVVSNSEIAVVRYAYVTIGAIVFVGSVLYAAAYWRDYRAKHRASTQHQQMSLTQQTSQKEADTEVSDGKPAERLCREK